VVPGFSLLKSRGLLLLQNVYFADRIELGAFKNREGKLRVLTSQPHVVGDVAPFGEIEQWFEGLGFLKVPGARKTRFVSGRWSD
jgi:hypothetical protein